MAKIHFVAKYTVAVIVVLSAGLLVERLIGIKRWWADNDLKIDDLVYNTSSPMTSRNFHSVLTKHYQKCVTQPAKPFCLLAANQRLEIFKSEETDSPNVEVMESRLQNLTSYVWPRRRRIHSLLITFTKLMKDNDVRVILLEPSMLYCLLSLQKKLDMLSGGFNPGSLLGSKNVVTIGVLGEDSKKIETSNFTKEVFSVGFKMMKFRRWVGKESQKSFETVHYFFVLQDVAVHAVVFYSENSHVYHVGLDPKQIDFEGLLFVNKGLFENFTLLPLDLSDASISRIYIPYTIRYFMKEIQTSKIVDCNYNSSGAAKSVAHPNLTKEQLQTRVVVALKELKTILIPQVTFFWLWSKSLLSWFTECDIFCFGTTLDLALKFKSIEGLNLPELLIDNEFLKSSNSSQSDAEFKYELDCHGLLVNMFILHEDTNGLWYKQSKEHQKTIYPAFPLCSTEIFGEKVHVPCNTGEILKLEYEKNSTFQEVSNQNDQFMNETTEGG